MANNGKFFIERNIFESDVWEKPAYYLKIWIWLIGKVNWKTVERGGKVFNRGEFITSYEDIINENKWVVGWRVEKLTKDQVFNVLDFFRKTQRIKTMKATRGLWIKILNYDSSQRLPKKENNDESNKESNAPPIDGQQGKRKANEIQMKERKHSPSLEAYLRGDRTFKPFYRGDPIVESPKGSGKLWVIPSNSKKWLEFAGKEWEIEWRQK